MKTRLSRAYALGYGILAIRYLSSFNSNHESNFLIELGKALLGILTKIRGAR